MLIDKRTLAGKLSPFINEQRVIIDNQGVNDIISGMLNTHDRYKSEYDKIYKYLNKQQENGEKDEKNKFDK